MLSSALLLLCRALPAVSQPDAQETTFDLQGTVFSIYDTDLDGPGSVSMNHYEISAGLGHQLFEQLKTGLGVRYTLQDYEFSGRSGFGGLTPWEDIHSYAISSSLSYSVDQHWSILVSPFVESSAESGADGGQSYSYGGFVFASYAASRDFILGFGGGVTSGLEETSFIPTLFLRWQITEKLLLTNPLEAGPTGPAGLELSYTFSPRWNIGAGAAYKSHRFRLDDEGVAPDGIGEFSGVPVWVRLSWQPANHTTLALHGGYSFAGEVVLEDRDGNKITDDEYQSAPFAAASLEVTF